ncbi:type 2 periplasmic-binding domain-containing protein [Peterkaempfera griseoplana]|uniref:hypothetical protein n=1 Tax=Peterkaempfera griseoplana TaxID=66896 RepID=UPI0006E1711A|nr:hypothetical protein [Peterkaempfera griseoplana]
MISGKAHESEGFVAVTQAVDRLWCSGAGRECSHHLAEDVDHLGLHPTAAAKPTVVSGFSAGTVAHGGGTPLPEPAASAEEKAFREVRNTRKGLPVPPPVPLRADERERSAPGDAPLRGHAREQASGSVPGTRDLAGCRAPT